MRLPFNGFILSMQAYVWRDLMPVAPPAGRPLNAVIEVQAAGALRFPAHLAADRVWIIKGREVWRPPRIAEQPAEADDRIRLFVARGPAWPPGAAVTVILRLLDRRSGGEALLRTEQTIQRTD
jgi:hypothetical protein